MFEQAAEQTLGRPVSLSPDTLEAALDPWHAVELRTMLGGPSPAAVRPLLDEANAQLAADQADLASLNERLRAADAALEQAVDAVLAG
jgi:argininosuccinate lyase